MGRKSLKPPNAKSAMRHANYWDPLYITFGVLACFVAVLAARFITVGAFTSYKDESEITGLSMQDQLLPRGEKRPLIFCHRGSSILAPENTLMAFDTAASIGCDVLELDIRYTLDSKLVVFHDPIVDRVTDGKGLVRNKTCEEIQQLDAAYYFTLDDGKTYPMRGKNVIVPTLLEFLNYFKKAARSNPNLFASIEIKCEDPIDSYRAVDTAWKMISNRKLGRRIVFASRNEQTNMYMSQKLPEFVPKMASEKEATWFLIYSYLWLHPFYSARSETYSMPKTVGGANLMDASLARQAHWYYKSLVYWTINSRELMEDCLEMKADGFVTDRVDLAVQLFRDEGLMKKLLDSEDILGPVHPEIRPFIKDDIDIEKVVKISCVSFTCKYMPYVLGRTLFPAIFYSIIVVVLALTYAVSYYIYNYIF